MEILWNLELPTTNLSHKMFYNTYNFTTDLSVWDFKNIINMGEMFLNSIEFNSNISNMDVSSAIDMTSMFENYRGVDYDLSGWCVSNILTKPNNFNLNSSISNLNLPVCVTCP